MVDFIYNLSPTESDWICPVCDVNWDTYWIDETSLAWSIKHDDAFEGLTLIDNPDDASLLMSLCCDQPMNKCDCGMSLPGDALWIYLKAHLGSRMEIYDIVSSSTGFDCTACEYYATHKCIPLRQIVKRILYKTHLNDIALIEPCEHFEPDFEEIAYRNIAVPAPYRKKLENAIPTGNFYD